MKLRPLNDRLIVERIESENKTSGGIIIPDTAKEKPIEAVVAAVSESMSNETDENAVKLKEGDKVLFGKFSGTDITVDGKDYLILRIEDILAVVEN